ncbi:MAG: hypothetical protein ACRDLY_03945 [Thermoleophilaceae bacterium]
MSKRLAELMGGALRVESEEGSGSTFHFEILAREAAPPARRDRREDQTWIAGKRLLVVTSRMSSRTAARRWTRSSARNTTSC